MFYAAAKVSLEWHMTNIIAVNNILFEFIWAVTRLVGSYGSLCDQKIKRYFLSKFISLSCLRKLKQEEPSFVHKPSPFPHCNKLTPIKICQYVHKYTRLIHSN